MREREKMDVGCTVVLCTRVEVPYGQTCKNESLDMVCFCLLAGFGCVGVVDVGSYGGGQGTGGGGATGYFLLLPKKVPIIRA